MTRRSRTSRGIERRLADLETEQSDEPKSIAEIISETLDEQEGP